MSGNEQIVDHSALKVNQISIIVLVLSGFVLNTPILPALVAAVMVGGSFVESLALFKLLYRHILKPAGVVAPHTVQEDPAPHEFAQLLGGLVLAAGVFTIYAGAIVEGWIVAWFVVLLAAANLMFGFCAGCFVYFHLARLGVRGFHPGTAEGKSWNR
jgi:hypothetical protein